MDNLFPDERLKRKENKFIRRIAIIREEIYFTSDIREKQNIYDVTLHCRIPDRMRAPIAESIVTAYLFSLVRGMIRHDRTNGSVQSLGSRTTRAMNVAMHTLNDAIHINESDLSLSHIRSHE